MSYYVNRSFLLFPKGKFSDYNVFMKKIYFQRTNLFPAPPFD